ncbi:MAG: helix-turn-helix domain-containing protein, partial [Chloroflexota bacterium]
MQNKQFGMRIRELRQQARLSQRELSKKVGIDFTYLSKMENGLLPPPSEKVIQRLAETLGINKDELLSLGGKIPSDIAEMLKNPEILERLRVEQTRKEKPVSLNESKNQSPKTSIKPAGVIAAIILVAIVATLIWFAAPTKTTALEANNRGVALNNEGEYLKAIEILNKAIEIDPNLALAYNNRGWSYLELG